MINKNTPEYVSITQFKDMLSRYNRFKEVNGREPRVVFIYSGGGPSVSLETFKDMCKRYEDFKMKNKREPRVIFIRSGGGESIPLETFRDMVRRYNNFKDRYGREPQVVYIERPRLEGEWTKRVLKKIGDFVDATTLYGAVARKCNYKYYYNDKYSDDDAVRRMTDEGINCTDACQLFSKVLEEMGYEVKIEHVRVKCNDGKWYGHYLLRVGGFELKDGTIWDYVSATKTGRPLGVPCCTAGFQHIGWGVITSD